MSIATPEGVDLDLVLAGLGSRFTAAMLDMLLRAVVIVAALMMASLGRSTPGVAVALAIGGIFLAWFGYDVLFELFAAGRTPGKRWTGLRVVTTSGDAVGAGASLVRNLLRIVDVIPGSYLVGLITVLATKRNQRVGDVIGGTLVVRERRGEAQPIESSFWDDVVDENLGAWDVSSVTPDELATVRRFLDRRASLTVEARTRIARDLASRLSAKVVAPETGGGPESFLEQLVAVKVRRARR